MAKVTIYPQNVCSRQMEVEYENGVITNVTITGGCQGNTRGLSALLIGRKVEDIIPILKGIECRGSRTGKTSCPDQLAQGLKQLLK